MSAAFPSPEQVIASLSIQELQELLGDLKLDAQPATALRLQRLVRELESFEAAMDVIAGPADMRRAA
ncbi:MAG: hypothetical protein ACR2NZ_10275 [Rubripirellula sp.]